MAGSERKGTNNCQLLIAQLNKQKLQIIQIIAMLLDDTTVQIIFGCTVKLQAIVYHPNSTDISKNPHSLKIYKSEKL